MSSGRAGQSSGQAAQHSTTEQDGFLGTLKSILEIIVFAIFLVTFVVQPFRIPSGSMEPTLRVGDFLLVDKQSYAAAGGWIGWCFRRPG